MDSFAFRLSFKLLNYFYGLVVRWYVFFYKPIVTFGRDIFLYISNNLSLSYYGRQIFWGWGQIA